MISTSQPTEHQRRQRITNHRLVINREQLFADNLGQRIKTRSRTAREQNGFFHFRFSMFDFRLLSLQRKSSSAHCCQKREPVVKSI
jgi:hypothetical protein